MTPVMCSFWKRTFTLVPLVPLIVISPHSVMCSYVGAYNHHCHHTHNTQHKYTLNGTPHPNRPPI
jgi:hypothetical protein